VWWSSMPAVLKGWVDRVFSPGFAYEDHPTGVKPLLKGRTAHLVLTSAASVAWLKVKGNLEVRVVRDRILGQCGIRTKRVDQIGRLGTVTDTAEGRTQFLATIAQAAVRV